MAIEPSQIDTHLNDGRVNEEIFLPSSNTSLDLNVTISTSVSYRVLWSKSQYFFSSRELLPSIYHHDMTIHCFQMQTVLACTLSFILLFLFQTVWIISFHKILSQNYFASVEVSIFLINNKLWFQFMSVFAVDELLFMVLTGIYETNLSRDNSSRHPFVTWVSFQFRSPSWERPVFVGQNLNIFYYTVCSILQ